MSDFYYFAQSIDDAALTLNTLDEATGYPTENLQDRNKNTIWKCGLANTSGYIQIDLGSSRACDFLILGNHNYTNTAVGIKLSRCVDSNGDFTPEGFSIGNGGYHDYVSGNLTNWIETFSSVESRYWRIYLEAMGIATYQQIGTIFLGTYWDHNHNPEIGIGGSSGYIIENRETSAGRRSANILNTTVRRQWNYDYKYIIASEETKFNTWRDTIFIGKGLSGYPFYFSDDQGTTLYFVRNLGELKLKEHAYQVYETSITLEEEL